MTEPERAPGGEPERQVSSAVEVAVDPATAFAIFTEELDLWWVRGPINHHAGGRVLAMRCEPGVGGRLLEIYDDETGDALELGRITVWDPGSRLGWRSSIDDVVTEVIFEAVGTGTTVRVVARIPAGGHDQGGTAWVRVVPKWFGAWCANRGHQAHQVRDLSRLALGVSYASPAATARWLARVFGFESPDPLPEGADPLPEGEHGHPWIEFRLGNSSLMVFNLNDEAPHRPSVHTPWVYVDDIEKHFRTATDGGARIVSPLASPWGLPFYVADDLEGNQWTFAQARPTMLDGDLDHPMTPMSAAGRFLAASKAHEVEAAAAELAGDVVMLNPATDDPVKGRAAVAAALRAVEAACDEFRHTHLLSDTGEDEGRLFGLVFEAKVGDKTLYGVDLVELDNSDRISRFTVMARPMAALMTLGARMSSTQQP